MFRASSVCRHGHRWLPWLQIRSGESRRYEGFDMGPSSMSPQSWRPCAPLRARGRQRLGKLIPPSGTYDVVSISNNSIMDRWVITPNCPRADGRLRSRHPVVLGRRAEAFYQGHDTWALALKVWFRSAPTRAKPTAPCSSSGKPPRWRSADQHAARAVPTDPPWSEPDSLQTGQSFVAVHSASHTACRAAPTKLSSSLSGPRRMRLHPLNKAIRAARR